jgi:UDP-3-O-[3-hydroxymyristoyl] glucosamine N-acyltransferase
MKPTHTIADLARLVGGTIRGDGSNLITSVADIREAMGHQAAWVSRERFANAVKTSQAGVVLVPTGFPETPMPSILCDNIEQSVAALLNAYARPVSRPDAGIHPTAVIDRSAVVGDSPAIGPHAVIGPGVTIGARSVIHSGVFIGSHTVLGDDCQIWPNAVISDGCSLGSRVLVHSCAVIGGDGFGFYFDGTHYVKIPHIGGVILEDDVEIGACTCVDRAKFGNTIIGRGTKIDNQVQVAHNCRLGAHNILAGQSGFAGSVRTGDYCVFGARVGSLDNLNIGNRVHLGAMSQVTKDLPDGLKASGFPAQNQHKELRERASIRRLPGYYEKLAELVERIDRLEASAHNNP